MIDIDELERLTEAATTGPWMWEVRGLVGDCISLMVPQTLNDGTPAHPLNLLNTQDKEWDANGDNNRAFIIAARQAVPQLIAELKRQSEKPTVVCLCGSTRFKEAFEHAEKEEGLAGHIVLTVACFGHQGDLSSEECEKGNPVKDQLDALHLRKIEMADEILVINVGGYVGESTRGEIAHALQHKKGIRWLEPA